jgi:type IV pilus assembly protein PilW
MEIEMTILRRAQKGFTLIELMLALTLGLLVSGIVITLYVNTARSLSQNERYAWMQENARYAMKVLSDDVSMADFWGRVISTDIISTTLAPPTGGCGEDVDLFDSNTALMVNNYHESPPATHFTPCAALSDNQVPNTDMLVLKRVEGSPTASTFVDVMDSDGDTDVTEIITTGASGLSSGVVYLRSTSSSGSMIDDAAPGNAPGLGETDWRYIPRIYFVRDYYETLGDGIPSLCRLKIGGIDLGTSECLAEGVEDFHVQFGIDADTDGIVNQYTATPTLAQAENVISARVYLLVRSIEPDPFFVNDTTYVLGDVTIPAANDGYYRRVYSTTIALRNTISRSLMQ